MQTTRLQQFRGFDLDVLTFGFGGRVGEGQEGEASPVEHALGHHRSVRVQGDVQPEFFEGFANASRTRVFIVVEVSSRERPVAHKVSTCDSTHQHLSIPVDDDGFAHHTVQASVDALTGHGMNRIVADEIVFQGHDSGQGVRVGFEDRDAVRHVVEVDAPWGAVLDAQRLDFRG